MPKITPQPNVPISFRLTPSSAAALRKIAAAHGCEPGDVLRVALLRWACFDAFRQPHERGFVSNSHDWQGVKSRMFDAYGAGWKRLPRERKTETICLRLPGRARDWYQRAAKVYDVSTSLLYFAAMVELLRALRVEVHASNRPVIGKPDTANLTEPTSESSADFEVEL
jgi:hypothetical protein